MPDFSDFKDDAETRKKLFDDFKLLNIVHGRNFELK
jgi:hypothetical protein